MFSGEKDKSELRQHYLYTFFFCLGIQYDARHRDFFQQDSTRLLPLIILSTSYF